MSKPGILASARRGASPPPTFSPTDLTLVGWWDPSDASWGTVSSGTAVAQWSDLSGQGRHLLSVSTVKPQRNVTINGLDALNVSDDTALDCDAGSDVLDISPWTYFCVVDLASTADFDRVFVARRSATTTADYQSPNAIFAYRASNVAGTYSISAFSAGTQGSTVTGNSGVMIVHSRFNGSNLYVGVNGVESAGVAVSAPANMRYLRCGGFANNTGNPPSDATVNSLIGVIGEHFLANQDVPVSEPVAYLADKWGVAL